MVVTMKRIAEKETDDKKSAVLENVLKGQAMETYIEHRTSEMKRCALCETIGYKRLPMKQVGKKWICLTCWRQMRETLDTLDRWPPLLSAMREMLHERFDIEHVTLQPELNQRIEQPYRVAIPIHPR